MDQEITSLLYEDEDKDPPQSEMVVLPPDPAAGWVGCWTQQIDGVNDGVLALWELESLVVPDAIVFIGGAEATGPGVFQLEFDSTEFPNGPYMLYCTVYDEAANHAAAEPIGLFIEIENP